MTLDRRYFIKSIIGSAFLTLTTMSNTNTNETVHKRVQRLFSFSHDTHSHNMHEPFSVTFNLKKSLRLPQGEGQELTDEEFVLFIANNIRQDFTSGNIVDFDGWQISQTEAAIIQHTFRMA